MLAVALCASCQAELALVYASRPASAIATDIALPVGELSTTVIQPLCCKIARLRLTVDRSSIILAAKAAGFTGPEAPTSSVRISI
jgi:hypothetical protein